jgi:hypothetical protein
MILYSLKCDKDHIFDSWFDGAQAFDKLARANMLSCSVCGSSNVERAIMAPQVSTSRSKTTGPLSAPLSPAEQAVADMRAKVEAESTDVGTNFATEARAMHDGESPHRSIFGEAKIEDAKALIDDGVPVVPLPWVKKRTN